MQFDNTYFNKLNDFYAECDADIPPNPELIKFNKDLATQLGINTKNINLTSIFSGSEKPKVQTLLHKFMQDISSGISTHSLVMVERFFLAK